MAMAANPICRLAKRRRTGEEFIAQVASFSRPDVKLKTGEIMVFNGAAWGLQL
jgi:hypothetical protein